ncbi:hypothetical protein HK097_000485 [Rhizophlyctis rosea]|uniref:Uncharacterized protein n=1 Tax=Rhizophlyctis rosea TaxID=64517 RepID=A0AAD5S803_9FUNG|nr:hypothetical protein HK097_000485 [Rhizophlyctis rosea]
MASSPPELGGSVTIPTAKTAGRRNKTDTGLSESWEWKEMDDEQGSWDVQDADWDWETDAKPGMNPTPPHHQRTQSFTQPTSRAPSASSLSATGTPPLVSLSHDAAWVVCASAKRFAILRTETTEVEGKAGYVLNGTAGTEDAR